MNNNNDYSKKESLNNSGIGRKVRGQNILTKEMKKELFNVLKSEYEKLDKLMNVCSFEERAKILKGLAKYLCNGNDEISVELKEIIWKQTEGHYRKLNSYINHLSPREKITVLRGLLSDIAPEHRKNAVDIISSQKIKF